MQEDEHPPHPTVPISPGDLVSETPPKSAKPRTTLIVPVSPDFEGIKISSDSPDPRHYPPLYVAQFKPHPEYVPKHGNLLIAVDGPGEEQFQQRCSGAFQFRAVTCELGRYE